MTACRGLDEVKILLAATSGAQKYFRTLHRIKYPRLRLALGKTSLSFLKEEKNKEKKIQIALADNCRPLHVTLSQYPVMCDG